MASPKYKVGDIVRINWPGKCEDGWIGKITHVKPYDGPKIYDEWMCRATWDNFVVASVRQSRLCLVREDE